MTVFDILFACVLIAAAYGIYSNMLVYPLMQCIGSDLRFQPHNGACHDVGSERHRSST